MEHVLRPAGPRPAADAEGTLVVAGLPRGEYLARVVLPDGRALEAGVTVPAKAEALLAFVAT